MIRTRFFATVTALVTLALTGTALAASAQAAPEHATKLAAKPTVGQCRTTTFAQAGSMSDERKPVPCSKAHRLYTYAVVNAPRSVDMKHLSSNGFTKAAEPICVPRLWKLLGATASVRDRTAYSIAFFAPTKAQRKAGARWIRCDLALYANNTFAPLPKVTHPVLGGPISDSIARCYLPNAYSHTTTCSRPHQARADQTFSLPSKARPSAATIDKNAAKICPDKLYTYPNAVVWKLGDHTVVCYSVTTS